MKAARLDGFLMRLSRLSSWLSLEARMRSRICLSTSGSHRGLRISAEGGASSGAFHSSALKNAWQGRGAQSKACGGHRACGSCIEGASHAHSTLPAATHLGDPAGGCGCVPLPLSPFLPPPPLLVALLPRDACTCIVR